MQLPLLYSLKTWCFHGSCSLQGYVNFASHNSRIFKRYWLGRGCCFEPTDRFRCHMAWLWWLLHPPHCLAWHCARLKTFAEKASHLARTPLFDCSTNWEVWVGRAPRFNYFARPAKSDRKLLGKRQRGGSTRAAQSLSPWSRLARNHFQSSSLATLLSLFWLQKASSSYCSCSDCSNLGWSLSTFCHAYCILAVRKIGV